MNATRRIAEWTGALAFEDVPAPVVEAAKLHVLDVLGCGLAAHGLGIAGEGRQAMAELGGEPDDCGSDRRCETARARIK